MPRRCVTPFFRIEKRDPMCYKATYSISSAELSALRESLGNESCLEHDDNAGHQRCHPIVGECGRARLMIPYSCLSSQGFGSTAKAPSRRALDVIASSRWPVTRTTLIHG